MKIKFLLKWLLAILIFAVSFAVVYWYFTTYVQSNKTDTKHIVGRKNIEDVLTVYGSVMSDSDRALSFQTNGIVKKIIKKEGDDVSNGEIIAYLNNDDLNFDIKKAYVDLEIEKSKLEDIKGGSTRSEAVVAQKQFILVSASARKEINQSIIELDNILNDTKQVIFLELDKLFSNAKTRRPYFEYSISHSAKQKFEKGRRDIQYILDSWDKYVFNTADIDKITAEFFISSVDGVLYDIYVIHNYLQKIILDLSEELVSIDDADQELLNRVYKITSAARKKVVEKKDSVIFELSNVSKSASDYKNTIEEIKSKIQTQELYIKAKQLDIKSIESDLEKTILRATVDGKISELDLTTDQNISAYSQVGRVFTEKDYQIEVDVSELDIEDLNIGDKVLINFNSLDGDYDGFISDISLQERIKNNIPVYVVTIRFDTDKVNVKTGFGVDVKITKKNYKHALYVPQTALFTDSSGNKNNVFVKDFMSEKVKKVKIEIVDIVGVDVIVKKGLNPGDIVVTNPEKYLRHR